MLAAQTTLHRPPQTTRRHLPLARAAAAKPAPVPVTPADVAPLLGTWQIPLETPTGRLVATLVFRVEAGKVVAGVSAPQFPEHKITDITKAGNVVTLKASTDYSGALTAFSGPVSMVLTLTPKGADRRRGSTSTTRAFRSAARRRRNPERVTGRHGARPRCRRFSVTMGADAPPRPRSAELHRRRVRRELREDGRRGGPRTRGRAPTWSCSRSWRPPVIRRATCSRTIDSSTQPRAGRSRRGAEHERARHSRRDSSTATPRPTASGCTTPPACATAAASSSGATSRCCRPTTSSTRTATSSRRDDVAPMAFKGLRLGVTHLRGRLERPRFWPTRLYHRDPVSELAAAGRRRLHQHLGQPVRAGQGRPAAPARSGSEALQHRPLFLLPESGRRQRRAGLRRPFHRHRPAGPRGRPRARVRRGLRRLRRPALAATEPAASTASCAPVSTSLEEAAWNGARARAARLRAQVRLRRASCLDCQAASTRRSRRAWPSTALGAARVHTASRCRRAIHRQAAWRTRRRWPRRSALQHQVIADRRDLAGVSRRPGARVRRPRTRRRPRRTSRRASAAPC